MSCTASRWALGAGMRAADAALSRPRIPDLMPADTYTRLATDLRAVGVSVVADVSGAVVTALLEGGVSVLKISHEQLIAGGRARSGSVPELDTAIRELMAAGAEHVVVSRAAEPALSVIDGALLQAAAPTLSPVEPRGAGDSMTAGLATALARGADMVAALRLGVAAGALNITRRGLGTGLRTAAEQVAERIRVQPVDERAMGDVRAAPTTTASTPWVSIGSPPSR